MSLNCQLTKVFGIRKLNPLAKIRRTRENYCKKFVGLLSKALVGTFPRIFK